MRRFLSVSIVLLLLLVVIGVVYNQYLMPAPELIVRTRATNTARRMMMDLDWTGALNAIESAQRDLVQPDWELITWQTVLLEKLNQEKMQRIEQALDIGTVEDVWITYGLVATLADEPSLILTAGQKLVDYDANSVQGHYLMAQAYDIQEDYDTALQYYGITLDKLEQSKSDEGIYLAVRQRVAQINIDLIGDDLTG